MNERCMRILDMVREAGSVEVSALAETLGVSSVTIRKDLAQLEKERLLRRQHGSAVRISPDDVAYRMAFDYGPKRRIAQRAAALVQDGETVMIESGSTCALLAAELAENRRDVTIVTNSAFIAGYVGRMPGAKTVLLGGNYDPDAQTATGPLVRVCAREFFVDKFFFGTDGFDPAFGFSNVDMLRAEAVRAMGERAAKRIVLTDASKFGRRSVVMLMPTEDVSAVVTDQVPADCRASLEAAGVELILA